MGTVLPHPDRHCSENSYGCQHKSRSVNPAFQMKPLNLHPVQQNIQTTVRVAVAPLHFVPEGAEVTETPFDMPPFVTRYTDLGQSQEG